MAKRLKKTDIGKSGSGGIVKTQLKDPVLTFSFRLFDSSDEALCPKVFKGGYVQVLMTRLKELENWTLKDFTTKQSTSLRNHTHDWAKTKRPSGFQKLPTGFTDYQPWQFCLSANEYGRVHGVISGHVFYIVWLDQDHNLY